ncbi:hypothetical protein HDU98_008120 [Podochytrium sp. JEL0797]|nr:hypothetical protein HDU98_008120 [Podochytrium sp. JEL0797]
MGVGITEDEHVQLLPSATSSTPDKFVVDIESSCICCIAGHDRSSQTSCIRHKFKGDRGFDNPLLKHPRLQEMRDDNKSYLSKILALNKAQASEFKGKLKSDLSWQAKLVQYVTALNVAAAAESHASRDRKKANEPESPFRMESQVVPVFKNSIFRPGKWQHTQLTALLDNFNLAIMWVNKLALCLIVSQFQAARAKEHAPLQPLDISPFDQGTFINLFKSVFGIRCSDAAKNILQEVKGHVSGISFPASYDTLEDIQNIINTQSTLMAMNVKNHLTVASCLTKKKHHALSTKNGTKFAVRQWKTITTLPDKVIKNAILDSEHGDVGKVAEFKLWVIQFMKAIEGWFNSTGKVLPICKTNYTGHEHALINAHLEALDFFEKNVEYHEAVWPDKPLSVMPVFSRMIPCNGLCQGSKEVGTKEGGSGNPSGTRDFAVLRPLEEEAEIIAHQIKEGTFVPKKFDTLQGMMKGFSPLPKSSTTMKSIRMDTMYFTGTLVLSDTMVGICNTKQVPRAIPNTPKTTIQDVKIDSKTIVVTLDCGKDNILTSHMQPGVVHKPGTAAGTSASLPTSMIYNHQSGTEGSPEHVKQKSKRAAKRALLKERSKLSCEPPAPPTAEAVEALQYAELAGFNMFDRGVEEIHKFVKLVGIDVLALQATITTTKTLDKNKMLQHAKSFLTVFPELYAVEKEKAGLICRKKQMLQECLDEFVSRMTALAPNRKMEHMIGEKAIAFRIPEGNTTCHCDGCFGTGICPKILDFNKSPGIDNIEFNNLVRNKMVRDLIESIHPGLADKLNLDRLGEILFKMQEGQEAAWEELEQFEAKSLLTPEDLNVISGDK